MSAAVYDPAPVVFLHGLLESPAIWGLTIDAGSGRGEATYAPALPGHRGDAPRGAEAAHLLSDHCLADHYAAEIRARFGARRVRLVGHSTGGLVALTLAARHPALVRDVLLVASLGAGSRGREASPMEAALLMPVVGVATARLLLTAWLSSETSFVAGLRSALAEGEALEWTPLEMRTELLTGCFATQHAVARWLRSHSIEDVLGAVTAPILALVPALDTVVPAAHQLSLLSALPYATGLLIDTGHLPMLSAPRLFHSVFTTWLTGGGGSAGAPRAAEPAPSTAA